MSNRFPLIADSSANQIKELASGDTLNLAGNNGAGVVTANTLVATYPVMSPAQFKLLHNQTSQH